MRSGLWTYMWPALSITVIVMTLGSNFLRNDLKAPCPTSQSITTRFWPISWNTAPGDANAETEAVKLESKAKSSVKTVPHYMYPYIDPELLGREGSLCSTMCKDNSQCLEDCKSVKGVLDVLNTHQSAPTEAKVFIVPLDRFALLHTTKQDFKEDLESMIHNLTHTRQYFRFGGADHAFLCLSKGCSGVIDTILDKHDIGRDSRMMWYGRAEHTASRKDKWPCSNRVMELPEVVEKALANQNRVVQPDFRDSVNDMLGAAAAELVGKRIYKCDGESWNTDIEPYMDLKNGFIVIEKYKLAFCGIPKCGSTGSILLLKKMLMGDKFNSSNPWPIHTWDGFTWVSNTLKHDKFNKIVNDPSWVKAVFVREPSGRFLSAYLNKIGDLKEYWRVDWTKTSKKPTLSWVVDHYYHMKRKELDSVDHHFRVQSSFCGLRYLRYDFMGNVKTMSADMEAFLKSMELWEEHGATGWGNEGDMGINEWTLYKRTHDANSVVKEYYDDEMYKKVKEMYDEDYKRFGFPLDKPNSSS